MKTARITGNVQTMENQTVQAGGSAGEYADIIELPHHVSPRRPHMPCGSVCTVCRADGLRRRDKRDGETDRCPAGTVRG